MAAKAAPKRKWYARAAIEHVWSRTVLVRQVDTGLYPIRAARDKLRAHATRAGLDPAAHWYWSLQIPETDHSGRWHGV